MREAGADWEYCVGLEKGEGHGGASVGIVFRGRVGRGERTRMGRRKQHGQSAKMVLIFESKISGSLRDKSLF